MKILHLLSQTELTGAEVYAQTLIQRQIVEGHSVFLASDSWHLPELVTNHKLPISKINHWPWNQTTSVQKLVQLIQENHIEVIHSHSRAAARAANRVAKKTSIARVTSLHGRQHSSLSKKIFNIYGDYQIAVCENIRTSQIERFSTDPSRIKVIRNPFNLSHFNSQAASQSQSDRTSIAWIGRSSGPKGKNLESLLMTNFQIWKKSGKDFCFHIVATNKKNFSQAFQTWLNQHNNDPFLVFHDGHISDLNDFMLTQDLILGSGRVAVEALLLGKPTLAFGEYNYQGLVSQANLADCLASNFGDIGTDAMTGHFDWSKIGEDILSFIEGDHSASLTPESSQALQTALVPEFSLENIHQKIIQVYEAALMAHHCRGWLPILMYHKIPDADIPSKHKIFVNKNIFEKHLRFFQNQKFTYLNFKDLLGFLKGQKSWADFPKKPLMLTFDDGYLDNLENAQPLLQKYKAKAVIYLLANHDLTQNTWDLHDPLEPKSNLMNFSQKKQLSPEVFEIGSHGFNHLDLTTLPASQVQQELKDSREKLSREFDQEIVSLAYPFGIQNPETEALAQKTGYEFAVNTDKGAMSLAENRYSIFRVNIFPDEGRLSLWKKTRPWYRNYYFKKRGQ